MSDEIKKGLLGIVVDETTISQVMPDINSLTYRGYAVQDLCEKCNFEEVAYLVLNGELPNKKQLKNFVKEERLDRKLSKEILSDIRKMPKKAHPMDVVRTAVSLMALEDKETKDNAPEANMTEFGKSKLLNYKELESLGYNIVIYPVTTQRLAMKNVEDGLKAIFEDGHQNNIIDKMQTRKKLYDLVEYEKYNSLDEKIYNFNTDGHDE